MIDSNKTRFDNIFVKYFIFIITKITRYTPFLMLLEKYNVRYIVCSLKANILHCIYVISKSILYILCGLYTLSYIVCGL